MNSNPTCIVIMSEQARVNNQFYLENQHKIHNYSILGPPWLDLALVRNISVESCNITLTSE